MNKVFVLAPQENWIVDRFVKEWNEDNGALTVNDPTSADVIWLFADWCFSKLPMNLLGTKKVITTIHHIVPEKFGPHQLQEFKYRDSITNVYHVPNKHTESFVKGLTNKPVVVIPYWANDKIWRKTGDKLELRKKYGLPLHDRIIGSFQRDTEGADLISPKLEKGPDLFVDFCEAMCVKSDAPAHVLLAGWRRQYVINRLKNSSLGMSIPFTYIELPTQDVINELYQTLDIYPVTARYEGGPQSLIECGLLDIPVVSRDIGMASQVLPATAINEHPAFATPAVPSIDALRLPGGYKPYIDLINSL
jgi:hypothetical protein